MPKLHFVLLVFLALVWAACTKSQHRAEGYFDSLINAQTSRLIIARPRVVKVSSLKGKQDEKSFLPDSLTLNADLAIFRVLNTVDRFEKVSYKVDDRLRDEHSNLLVKAYTATDNDIPVKQVRIYYFQSLKNIKHIVAECTERKALYSLSRHLEMDFDDMNGAPMMTAYRVTGTEKVILGDSLKFSVDSKISFPGQH